MSGGGSVAAAAGERDNATHPSLAPMYNVPTPSPANSGPAPQPARASNASSSGGTPSSTTPDLGGVTRMTAEQFYQSYDPELGLHTAAVLGGILGCLIIYVTYRTKCRKAAIRLAKRHAAARRERKILRERVPSSVTQTLCQYVHDVTVSSLDPNCSLPPLVSGLGSSGESIAGGGGGRKKSRQFEGHQQTLSAGAAYGSRASETRAGGSPKGPVPPLVVIRATQEGDESNTQGTPVVTLPKAEADPARATAVWVQEQPLTSRSMGDLSGVILQVQPGLMSAAGYSHSCGSCPLTHLPSSPAPNSLLVPTDVWNKSLPILPPRSPTWVLTPFPCTEAKPSKKDLGVRFRKQEPEVLGAEEKTKGRSRSSGGSLRGDRKHRDRDGKVCANGDSRTKRRSCLKVSPGSSRSPSPSPAAVLLPIPPPPGIAPHRLVSSPAPGPKGAPRPP